MDYVTSGFEEKFLTRKTPDVKQQILEAESSLQIEELGGETIKTANFIRSGLAKDKPDKGEKIGAIYYASDTAALTLWDGLAWKTITLS